MDTINGENNIDERIQYLRMKVTYEENGIIEIVCESMFISISILM